MTPSPEIRALTQLTRDDGIKILFQFQELGMDNDEIAAVMDLTFVASHV